MSGKNDLGKIELIETMERLEAAFSDILNSDMEKFEALKAIFDEIAERYTHEDLMTHLDKGVPVAEGTEGSVGESLLFIHAWLQAPRAEDKEAIVEVLRRMGDRGFEGLLHIHTDGQKPRFQYHAIALRLMVETDGTRSIPHLLEVIEKHPSETTRGHACMCLGEIGGSTALEALLRGASPSGGLPDYVQGCCTQALGVISDPRAVPILDQRLRENENEMARTMTAVALLKIEGPAAIEKVDKAYPHLIQMIHPLITELLRIGAKDPRAYEILYRVMAHTEFHAKRFKEQKLIISIINQGEISVPSQVYLRLQDMFLRRRLQR